MFSEDFSLISPIIKRLRYYYDHEMHFTDVKIDSNEFLFFNKSQSVTISMTEIKQQEEVLSRYES